jgi:hypothetical protein
LKRNGPLAIAVAIIAIAGGAGCDEADSEAEDRGAAAVELCEGHGGVAALEDDVVICRDQSAHQGNE